MSLAYTKWVTSPKTCYVSAVALPTYLSVNHCFPSEPGLASSLLMAFFLHKMFGNKQHRLFLKKLCSCQILLSCLVIITELLN